MVFTNDESVFFQSSGAAESFRPKNFAFIIIYGGTLHIEANGLSEVYQKGSILIISPKKVYKILSFSKSLKVYIVSADLKEVQKKTSFNFSRYDLYKISNADKTGNNLKFSQTDFSTIIGLAEKIFYYKQTVLETTFTDEICTGLFSTLSYIIAGVLLSKARKSELINTRKEDIAMKFLDLCSAHCKTHKELSFYARELSISIKYLSNCVREITEEPPTKFIADALINEAKIHLLNTGKSIKIIAEELGFSDQYSFGKFFKKHSGQSPKNFKSQNKLVATF